MSRSTIPAPRVTTARPRSLTSRELIELRRMLQQQRDFRLDQLAELRRLDRSRPARGVEREINRSLAAGARAALRDVLAALARMDAGRYGVCLDCAGPVETGRLEILPQVARCVPCERAAAAARIA